MERVEIVEVSPRDGLQNEAEVWPVAARLTLIDHIVAAGFRRLEAASFVNPQKVPQMAGAEEMMAGAASRPDARFIALALNRRGVERALAAGAKEINFVLAASDSFAIRNSGAPGEALVEALAEAVALANAAGARVSATISVAFGCPFEGEIPPARVTALCAAAARAGVFEVALADTIGVAVPTAVRAAFAEAAGVVGPDVALRAHFHNTRNTAVANAVAAYEAGVRTLDGSLAGIGGCPFAPGAAGNVASEDLVYCFERMGISTGIDLERAIAAARFIAQTLGRPTPGMLSRAGGFP